MDFMRRRLYDRFALMRARSSRSMGGVIAPRRLLDEKIGEHLLYSDLLLNPD
jgi:hypothetical protein